MFVRPVSNDLLPIRSPGPHLPDGTPISPLSLFELYFNEEAIDRIWNSTFSYAEMKSL